MGKVTVVHISTGLPERLLTKFEEKNGNSPELTHKLCDIPENKPTEIRKIEQLLLEHSRLIAMNIGYGWGYQAAEDDTAEELLALQQEIKSIREELNAVREFCTIDQLLSI